MKRLDLPRFLEVEAHASHGIETCFELEKLHAPGIVQTPSDSPDAPEMILETTQMQTTQQKEPLLVEMAAGELWYGLTPLAQIKSKPFAHEVVPEARPGVGVKLCFPPARSWTVDAKPGSSFADFEAEWKKLPSEVKANAAIKCRREGQDWKTVSWKEKFKLLDVDALTKEMKQKLCALELIVEKKSYSDEG